MSNSHHSTEADHQSHEHLHDSDANDHNNHNHPDKRDPSFGLLKNIASELNHIKGKNDQAESQESQEQTEIQALGTQNLADKLANEVNEEQSKQEIKSNLNAGIQNMLQNQSEVSKLSEEQ